MLSSKQTRKLASQVVSKYLRNFLRPDDENEIFFLMGGLHVKRYLIDENYMVVVYGIKFKLDSILLDEMELVSDQASELYRSQEQNEK